MIWNIVDRRGNQFRWAKVHAIVEATCHDNSVSGADQASRPAAEAEVVFDEKRNISIHDAINWANSQSCPVTLYLRDVSEVPRSSSREVDAAARILDGFGGRQGWWPLSTPSFDDMDDTRKSDLKFMIEGMLRAAAEVRGQGSG